MKEPSQPRLGATMYVPSSETDGTTDFTAGRNRFAIAPISPPST
jgi:hypothetical protein